MSQQQIGRAIALAVVVALLSGCSLFTRSTQPDPGARRNLHCIVEYRPSPAGWAGPDILFLALASPYKLDNVYMNPVDMLVHAAFAPGRHLTAPVRVTGATCEPPLWNEGRRIPQLVSPDDGLKCRRVNLEQVVIEAETAYGHCRVEIPAGQTTPICRDWYGERGAEIQRILDQPCTAPRPFEGGA